PPIQEGQSLFKNYSLSRRRCRRSGLDSDQSTIVFRSQKVKQTIWSLAHIANPLLKITQHPFAMQFFPLVVEVYTRQMSGSRDFSGSHPANEHASFPGGKLVAGVERHAGYCDGWDPVHERRLHSFLPGIFRNARTEIKAAVADHRPAVILSSLKDVDFVA